MKRVNSGFALIEVVMAFFLITLLGTMLLLVYNGTISGYDNKRTERKAYILMNNIHQDFMSSPEAYYINKITKKPESSAGFKYYDEHLREIEGEGLSFSAYSKVYIVLYSVVVDLDYNTCSLYLSSVEYKGKEIIKDLSLGKMRISS